MLGEYLKNEGEAIAFESYKTKVKKKLSLANFPPTCSKHMGDSHRSIMIWKSFFY